MSGVEREINDFLENNAREFLRRLKAYAQKHCKRISTGSSSMGSSVAARLIMIDESIKFDARKTLRSDSNGRESRFDLYYKSEDVKFIVELKPGKVGFRGAGQAAYYNACVGGQLDCVLLIGEDKGPDFDDFISKCITPDSWRKVVFLRYEELGLDITKKPTRIAFRNV